MQTLWLIGWTIASSKMRPLRGIFFIENNAVDLRMSAWSDRWLRLPLCVRRGLFMRGVTWHQNPKAMNGLRVFEFNQNHLLFFNALNPA
jgi:hypothetical protein